MTDPLGIVADLIKTVSAGQPIDGPKVAKLQALAIVQAGQEFVADSIARQEEADERLTE